MASVSQLSIQLSARLSIQSLIQSVSRARIPTLFSNGQGEHPSVVLVDRNGLEAGSGLRQHHGNEKDRPKSEANTEDPQTEQVIANLLKDKATLASKCEEEGNFRDARQHYHELYILKAQRLIALQKNDHNASAETIEGEELYYKLKYSQTTSIIGEHHEVATALRDIYERSKHKHPNIQNPFARIALLELCKVLRRGGSQGLEEARKLYRQYGDLDSRTSQEDSSFTWRLQNALNVVHVLIEQQHYDSAISELSSVWRKCNDISANCAAEIESEIENLLETFRLHGIEDVEAWIMQALHIVCSDNRQFSSPFIKVLTTEGLRLHSVDRHVEAVGLLQKSLTSTSNAALAERLRIGWPLALSYCQIQNYEVSASVLKSIFSLSNAQTTPSDYHVTALLAHVLLASGQPVSAKQNAQIVWNVYRTQNILLSHEHYHADTLIRAMAQEEYYKGKWLETKEIWDELYQNARRLCSDRQAMNQVQFHVATGRIFAENYEIWRKPRRNPRRKWSERMTTGERNLAEIKKQVIALQEKLIT